MIIFYSVPILPIVVLVLAVLNAGASWVKDILPFLAGLLVLKNLYIDLFYSIYKMHHSTLGAIMQFVFGIIRVAVFIPMLKLFLTSSGGLLGILDILLGLIFIVPFISILWLLGELSSLAYSISNENETIGMTVISNVIAIIGIFVIYFFFNH